MKHDQSAHHALALGISVITTLACHSKMTLLGSSRRYLDSVVVKGLPGNVSPDLHLQISNAEESIPQLAIPTNASV